MNDQKDDSLDKLLSILSSRLSLLSNYGLAILKNLGQAGPMESEHIPVVLSLRHTMELLEGISILIRNQLADPALLLLRGMFESVIQTLFILAKNTKNRGLSFLYFDLLNNIGWHEKLDPSSQKGKEFMAWMKKDTYLNSIKFSKPPDFDVRLSTLISQKNIPEYSKVHAEYEKQKLSGKKVKNWFSLFSGYQSIEQVAADIGLGGTYQIFYRHLSESVHGIGIVRGKFLAEGGKGAIMDIRSPHNIQYVVSTSISVSFQLLKKIIEVMCPEKVQEFGDFYIREIREVYLRASEANYIEIINETV
jgi:hypothetical protein